MTNTELSIMIAEVKAYLEAKVPHLATKEDVSEAIEKHCDLQHVKGTLSAKQVSLIVGGVLGVLGALTAFLTGLVG